MNPLLEFGILCFTSVFTMMNPIGVIPPYMSMSEGMVPAEARKLAIKATLTAFVVLCLFALAGNWIFAFFHITTDSLRVVGGILFFILGLEMLQARFKRRPRESTETEEAFNSDLAISPLAIPFICGPGSVTMVILLMEDANSMGQKTVFFVSIAAVLLATCLILLGGRRIIQFLGVAGSNVAMRIMGLIVMVIAVEFFFSGLKPILRGLLEGLP